MTKWGCTRIHQVSSGLFCSLLTTRIPMVYYASNKRRCFFGGSLIENFPTAQKHKVFSTILYGLFKVVRERIGKEQKQRTNLQNPHYPLFLRARTDKMVLGGVTGESYLLNALSL